MSYLLALYEKVSTWSLGTTLPCGEATMEKLLKDTSFLPRTYSATSSHFSNNRVYRFDPETGLMEHFADSLVGWAARILDDPEEVGFLTALAWQQAHGDIPVGKRLFSKIPFVLGGTAAIDNLYLGDPLDALRWRANLARH
jgi:hypothetical protein